MKYCLLYLKNSHKNDFIMRKRFNGVDLFVITITVIRYIVIFNRNNRQLRPNNQKQKVNVQIYKSMHKRMIESDQITFPSFAPSLSESPKPLRQSTSFSINQPQYNQIHKISIQIPQSMTQSRTQLNEQQNYYANKINIHPPQKQIEKESPQGVRIYCRLRPQVKTSYEFKYDTTMIDDGENCYSFDNIFGKYSSQDFIYKKITERHISDFMNGRNSTIFAYGQTGSGKTHTMFGDLKDSSQFGIIPRTLEQIFENNSHNDTISCAMLQIYNEKMMDLFSFPQQTNTHELKLKQINDNIFIQGLTEVQVQDKFQVLNLIRLGHKNRKVAATYNNDASSRSHTILFVYRTFEFQGQQYKCKLCFIDLAGSEKVRKSGVKGQTLQQAKKINLSLSCLGNVVHALTSNSEHIPYRNSKLTRILKDSLSGQTNTSIITTCSTDKTDYNETISTIKFAVRAKKIKNKKKLDNVQLSMEQVLKRLKKQLDETKKQLDWYKMKEELEKCNLVDIPEEDTCLMPLKQMMASGVSASSRILRVTEPSEKSDFHSDVSSILSESSSKRMH